jgi:hypothetical protein
VLRSDAQVADLHQYVSTQISDLNPVPNSSFEAPFEVEAVQMYLTTLVSRLADALFVCPVLLKFLDDDYGKSEIFKLQTDYFFCQVDYYARCHFSSLLTSSL